MGKFEVILNRREVLEHRHVEVMSMGVAIGGQESEVDSIWMKPVTCGQALPVDRQNYLFKRRLLDASTVRFCICFPRGTSHISNFPDVESDQWSL